MCVLGRAKEVGEESVDIIGEFGDFLCGFFGDFGGLFIVEHLEKCSHHNVCYYKRGDS